MRGLTRSGRFGTAGAGNDGEERSVTIVKSVNSDQKPFCGTSKPFSVPGKSSGVMEKRVRAAKKSYCSPEKWRRAAGKWFRVMKKS